MRIAIMALAAVLGTVVGAMLGIPPAPEEPDIMPKAWTECVARCEQESPEDRGQGCVDIDCNPLLPEGGAAE